MSYDAWDTWTPGIEFVYSDLNYGELPVVSPEGEFEVSGVAIALYVPADFDFDHVSDGYDGLNHVQAGVSWPIPFPGERELTACVSYSTAGENLRREEALDHDLPWAGIALPISASPSPTYRCPNPSRPRPAVGGYRAPPVRPVGQAGQSDGVGPEINPV